MSSCLSSGGGRAAYRLEALDLDVIKSPSSTSWISNSSSPSSTLSESSNCPLAISTRKPRTPRKRPNQTYNEAAAILSTAYPKIFPTTNTKPWKLPNSHHHTNNYTTALLFEPSELLMPFQDVDALLDSRMLLEKPVEIKAELNPFEKPCRSPPEIDSRGNSSECHDEFDAESILDEEIGEGIESIMGNAEIEEKGGFREPPPQPPTNSTFCYGYPVGLGLGFGMRRESRAAMRSGDHCDWWRFPCVNVVVDVNPNAGRDSNESKKKKVEVKKAESENCEDSAAQRLLLKLNYDGVLNAWSDKASPFSGDSPPSEAAGNDLRARLSQIDLFSDNGGVREREASVLRYKEKRRTRLFSKKIRYQVRKVNADRRPRMKGRFVRTPTSSDD